MIFLNFIMMLFFIAPFQDFYQKKTDSLTAYYSKTFNEKFSTCRAFKWVLR